MDGDTAVLDRPDTAEGTGDATPELIAPPEGAAPPAPETGTPESTPETDQPYVSPFEGKDLAEVEKDPVVEKLLKDRLAKEQESYRRREENAKAEAAERERQQQHAARREQAQRVLSGDAARKVLGIVQAAEEGKHNGDQNTVNGWVSNVAAEIADAVFMDQHDTYVAAQNHFLAQDFPNFKPTVEQATALEKASRAFDPLAMTRAVFDVLKSAATEAAVEAAEKRIAERTKAEAELAKEKAAEAARSDPAKQPTLMSGRTAAGGSPADLAGYEQKLAREGLTDSEWSTYMGLRGKAGLS